MKRVHNIALVEYLIGLAVALIVLRFAFAGVLTSYERRLFSALGVSDDARLLLGIPLAAGILYAGYRRGRYAGRAPNWVVVCGVCVIVFGAGAIAWLLTA